MTPAERQRRRRILMLQRKGDASMEASRLPRRRDGLPEMNRITIESADFKVTVEYERATDEINELVANLLRRWHAGMEVITEPDTERQPPFEPGPYP